ncbi:MAG TPA: FAD-dependent oxidoreductase [Vicinamibacterales bacterium]
MERPTHRVQCCIAGGGPAGMMLGLLLARSGIRVVVLEKHADFLRDFRGDTVHPSTLENLHELGMLDSFLQRPHQEVTELSGKVGDTLVTLADFSHLPTRCRFIALMPQWDFLDFLSEQARRYAGFELMMRAEVIDLIEEEGHIAGVRARTHDGELDVRADLVIGADGRQSIVRERAGLEVDDIGAPIDVLWMRLSRRPSDPERTFGNIKGGRVFIMLNRGEYWQCGFVIAKGGIDALRQQGLPAFRRAIAETVPFLNDRVDELDDWSAIKLLTVKIDRLREWCRPGLLCIGDAAHAMSPVGGVGINLAIQDAVAAANILADPLRRGTLSFADLQAVQERRVFPTRITQNVQVFIQNRVLSRVLRTPTTSVPLVVHLLRAWPALRRIPARLVGIGARAEHVRTHESPSLSALRDE